MLNARIFCKSLMLIAISGLGLLSGCSDDTSTNTSQNYNGPGSKWDLQLTDDGTFHIDHRPDVNSAIDYTVDGTYLRHASGFITLAVTGGEGADAPAAGSAAWALEAPGYAFMLKPLDGEQLIPMVTAGAASSDSVTITLSNAVNEIGGTSANGFMTGTISDGFGTGNMICMVDTNAVGSGKKIVSCVGQSPGDVNQMFNVLFVSR